MVSPDLECELISDTPRHYRTVFANYNQPAISLWFNPEDTSRSVSQAIECRSAARNQICGVASRQLTTLLAP